MWLSKKKYLPMLLYITASPVTFWWGGLIDSRHAGEFWPPAFYLVGGKLSNLIIFWHIYFTKKISLNMKSLASSSHAISLTSQTFLTYPQSEGSQVSFTTAKSILWWVKASSGQGPSQTSVHSSSQQRAAPACVGPDRPSVLTWWFNARCVTTSLTG